MDKIKHFFNFVWFMLKTLYMVLKDRRTWIVVSAIVVLWVWGWFNAHYYTQSPVKEWQPVIMKRTQPKKTTQAYTKVVEAKTITPTPKIQSEYEIVHAQKWGAELWRIYQLETQRGLTDYCRQSGKYGGFGVMNDKNKPHCYDTFQEAAERASYWFDKLNPGKSLAGALCQYNTGTPNLVNCFYYQHYLLVK